MSSILFMPVGEFISELVLTRFGESTSSYFFCISDSYPQAI